MTGTQGDGLIITTPGVRSGKPRIAGRRITVSDVVIWHEQMGIAPGQLAADYDLTLAQVYAALSYYHAHRDEISSEIEAGLSFAESLQNLSASPLDRKQQAERG
ncbi:MAG: DUF433 domain-containing protein [Chloroflexi bacterium]|nr:DUF433 domain-containing protein [Chloroflexota bacterium]